MRKTKFGYLLCGMFLLLAAAMFMPVEAEGAVSSLTDSRPDTVWGNAANWIGPVPAASQSVVIGGQVERWTPPWPGPVPPPHAGFWSWANETHTVTLNVPTPLLTNLSLGRDVPAVTTVNLPSLPGRQPTAGTLIIEDGGVLNATGNIHLGVGAIAGQIQIGTGVAALPGVIDIGGVIQGFGTANNTITFNHGSGVLLSTLPYHFPHQIIGNVNIIHSNGITELTGDNSYFNTTINGGTLAFAPGALGTGSVNVAGGTLSWLGSTSDSTEFGSALNVFGGTLDIPGQLIANIDATIGVFGTVTKTGTGTLIINALQSTMQPWMVNEGTLAVGPSGILTVNSTVDVDSASLNVNGGELNVIAGGALTVNDGNFRVNTGVVNIMGGGQVEVNDGIFSVVNGGVVTVDNLGTLNLENPSATVPPVTHSDPNNHVISAGSTLILNAGAQMYVGANTGLVILGNLFNPDCEITKNPDGIIWIHPDFDEDDLGPLLLGKYLASANVFRIPRGAGFPGGGGGGDGSDAPGLGSGLTEPTRVWTVLNGITYTAVRQPGGSFLLTVPAGTNISALSVFFGLPPMATMRPANGSVQNFSAGPVTYTVTAANRVTTRNIDVRVVVEGGGAPGDGDNGGNGYVVGGGSGSSGCNAGFAGLALFLAVPFFFRKRS